MLNKEAMATNPTTGERLRIVPPTTREDFGFGIYATDGTLVHSPEPMWYRGRLSGRRLRGHVPLDVMWMPDGEHFFYETNGWLIRIVRRATGEVVAEIAGTKCGWYDPDFRRRPITLNPLCARGSKEGESTSRYVLPD
jgi:hypothetical protein